MPASIASQMTSALHMLLHALQVDTIAHLFAVTPQVQARFGCTVEQAPLVQTLLVFKKQTLHRPELALRGCGFRCFGGKLGVRMRFPHGIVTEDVTHPVAEMWEQDLQCAVSLTAHRTFEVAVLDDRDRCRSGPWMWSVASSG